MSFSVNTNSNALAALQTLNMTTRSMATTQAHINSGYKIAGAKDDASTFAIAQGMRGDISGLKAVSDSLSLGEATVNVALSAAQQISDKLNDLKSKVTAAQVQGADVASIQKDVAALKQEIDDTANAAQFNGVNLLKNGGSGLTVISSLNRTNATTVSVAQLQVGQQDLTTAGTNLGLASLDVTQGTVATSTISSTQGATVAAGDTVKIDVGGGKNFTFEFFDKTGSGTLSTTVDANTTLIGVGVDPTNDSAQSMLASAYDAMSKAGFSVTVKNDGSAVVTGNGMTNLTATFADTKTTAAAGSQDPLTSVENAINNVKASLASLGSFANQLQSQGDFVKSLTDTLSTGVSSLVDADLAEESANLQALQTKQQLGIQALSIANQSSGAVLSLFR